MEGSKGLGVELEVQEDEEGTIDESAIGNGVLDTIRTGLIIPAVLMDIERNSAF